MKICSHENALQSKAIVIPVGAGIDLHPRTPRDVTEMWELVDCHRDDLRVWLPWVDATRTLRDVRNYAEYSQLAFARGSSFEYAVRIDGRLAGAIGTHDIDWINHSTSIGYWLAPGDRGRGAIARSVTALVAHCIDRLRLNRFEIRCVVENRQSRAVPERLGFSLEGILKEAYFLYDRHRDIALYAMTAEQSRAQSEFG